MSLLSSSVSPTQCLAEGAVNLKFTTKLKKGERGISQALVLMAETNMMPCFSVIAGALATFNSLAKPTD